MTQNKVSDCHGAKIIGWHNQPDFCEKCGKPCTPVEAKKLDVETFLAESEEAGAALKRKESKNVRPTEGWEKQLRELVEYFAVDFADDENQAGLSTIQRARIDARNWQEIKSFFAAELAKKDEEIENWKWAKEELQRNQEGELAKEREEERRTWVLKYENSIGNTRKLLDEALASYRAELREKAKEIWLPEKFNHESWCDAKDATWENPRCNCNISAYYDLVCELKKFFAPLAEPNNEK